MKHYSIDERKTLLKEYESSGENVKQFFDRYSIARPTLYYWMNESPNKKTKKLGNQEFVRLVQVEASVINLRRIIIKHHKSLLKKLEWRF